MKLADRESSVYEREAENEEKIRTRRKRKTREADSFLYSHIFPHVIEENGRQTKTKNWMALGRPRPVIFINFNDIFFTRTPSRRVGWRRPKQSSHRVRQKSKSLWACLFKWYLPTSKKLLCSLKRLRQTILCTAMNPDKRKIWRSTCCMS